MIKLVSTVGFIAVNKENKILLIKQLSKEKKDELKDDKLILPQNNKELEFSEEWTLPFGTVEEDEEVRDVLKKEMHRKLSCDIDSCEYFNLYFYDISDNFIKKVCYFYGTISGEAKSSDDSTMAEWVSLEKSEIENLNLPQEQKEVLKEFVNFFQDKFLQKMESF